MANCTKIVIFICLLIQDADKLITKKQTLMIDLATNLVGLFELFFFNDQFIDLIEAKA